MYSKFAGHQISVIKDGYEMYDEVIPLPDIESKGKNIWWRNHIYTSNKLFDKLLTAYILIQAMPKRTVRDIFEDYPGKFQQVEQILDIKETQNG
jgi:hypothetical protein